MADGDLNLGRGTSLEGSGDLALGYPRFLLTLDTAALTISAADITHWSTDTTVIASASLTLTANAILHYPSTAVDTVALVITANDIDHVYSQYEGGLLPLFAPTERYVISGYESMILRGARTEPYVLRVTPEPYSLFDLDD